MNTLGKALLVLGVVLAIGGGLFFWKKSVQSKEMWTKVSKEEMETILKDLNPMMIKQIASQPEGKKKITDELKQLLAFAAEARRTGLAADPAIKSQLQTMEKQITAQFYDKEIHKDQGPMPPFGFIEGTQVEAFYAKAGNTERFEKFLGDLLRDAREGGKLPEGQEPSDEEKNQVKDMFAKIEIYYEEANGKIASGELGADFKKRLELQIKLQQSAYLAQKYSQDKLTKELEIKDEDVTAYIASHPEYDMTAKKTKAEEILAKAQAGEDFAKLADENSEDPGNTQGDKKKGGLYEKVKKGQFVPEFEQMALSLEPGKIADKLVESQFGYHIIKLESKGTEKTKDGKEEESYNVRHILIGTTFQDKENPMSRPMPVKDYVKGKLQKERREKLIEEIKTRNGIEVAEDFELPEIKDEDLPKPDGMMGPGGPAGPGKPGKPGEAQQIDPKEMEKIKKQIEEMQKKAPANSSSTAANTSTNAAAEAK